jgi:hypothetical protein
MGETFRLLGNPPPVVVGREVDSSAFETMVCDETVFEDFAFHELVSGNGAVHFLILLTKGAFAMSSGEKKRRPL